MGATSTGKYASHKYTRRCVWVSHGNSMWITLRAVNPHRAHYNENGAFKAKIIQPEKKENRRCTRPPRRRSHSIPHACPIWPSVRHGGPPFALLASGLPVRPNAAQLERRRPCRTNNQFLLLAQSRPRFTFSSFSLAVERESTWTRRYERRLWLCIDDVCCWLLMLNVFSRRWCGFVCLHS